MHPRCVSEIAGRAPIRNFRGRKAVCWYIQRAKEKNVSQKSCTWENCPSKVREN